MRTTVTLDPDVAAALKRVATERQQPFKQVLNDAIRRGLGGGSDPDTDVYRVPSRPMGLREGIDLDKALALAAGDEDAETLHKLRLRK